MTTSQGGSGTSEEDTLHQGGPRDTDPEVGEWSGADDSRVDLLAPSWRNIWTRSSRHHDAVGARRPAGDPAGRRVVTQVSGAARSQFGSELGMKAPGTSSGE